MTSSEVGDRVTFLSIRLHPMLSEMHLSVHNISFLIASTSLLHPLIITITKLYHDRARLIEAPTRRPPRVATRRPNAVAPTSGPPGDCQQCQQEGRQQWHQQGDRKRDRDINSGEERNVRPRVCRQLTKSSASSPDTRGHRPF